jgi:hypothetical protein
VSLDRARVLRDERNAVLDLCRTLTDAEWASASDCVGWSVKDVIAHMGAAFHGCFTPWLLRVMRTNNIERSNDADVGSRRGWEPVRVLEQAHRVLADVAERDAQPAHRRPLGDTTLRPWRDYGLAIEGDEELAARFLDALNLV